MKIDLTCPVELWQYAMPTEDDAECTFVMNNLSDKVVVSVQVTLACYDKEDQLLFRQTERVQGLKAGVGERFSIMLLPTQWRDVEGVDLIIEKVWFDDATIWRKGNAPLAHYTANALPNGRALDQLRFVAGKDAVGYPQVQEEVWLCVCGRANAKDSDRCCRCERRRDAVFASFTRENVAYVVAAHEQKLAQTARKAREENNLLQEKQEKQRVAKSRRRQRTLRVTIAALCLAAAVCVAVFWGIPALRYHAAENLLNDGKYDEAREAFAAMGAYQDAAKRLPECDYAKAKAALGKGDEAELRAAAESFAALDDYEDSALLAKIAVYQLGDLYLEAGSYEAAAEQFQALGDYEDSEIKLKEAAYRQADALMKAGNHQVARVLFESVAAYKDAQDKATQCLYLEGKALFDAGDYAGAAKLFSSMGDYEDAARLAQEANYQLAESKLLEGAFEEAGRLYQLAGDYADASAKANDCLYQLAQQTKSASDYAKAAELFLMIPGYLDSDGQVRDCLYLQALAKKEEGDLAGAAALLGADDSQRSAQATALYEECQYLLAMQAIEDGNAAHAETLLAQAGDYKDSEKQLRAVRYQLAEEALTAGKLVQARERYEALDGYKDSKAKLKQCDYELAKEALDNGDFAAAAAAFEKLGNYKDSKGFRSQAIFARASALEGAGDYAAAAELYGTLKTTEATERYNACRYILAEQLRESGDLPGAGAAFAQLGDYRDAKAQSDACYEGYFGNVADEARAAMQQKDYFKVVASLDGFAMDDLTKAYGDLPEIYREACYLYAEQLYRDGKPYEAMPYYQRAGEYRDAAEKKLHRRAYLILGSWKSSTDKTAAFYPDGSCELMGEKSFFRVSNFSLYTGTDAENMTITHKINTLDENSMSLSDIRNGQETVFKFEREGAWTLPEIAPLAGGEADGQPAAEESTEERSMQVTEDEDAQEP